MRVKNGKMKKWMLLLLIVAVILAGSWLSTYLLQKYWAHREGMFFPDYEKVILTADSDEETIFLQTGLGRPVVERLLAEDELQTILDWQEIFFEAREVSCEPMLGWFTREDQVVNAVSKPFVDLQPGDILLTLSTHSLGWRHGHAALVLDENTTLESLVWGTKTCFGEIEKWSSYADVAVLRVKEVTPKLQQQVAEYGREVLYGTPYHISAGFIGSKAPTPEAPQFGVHCSYLVWYAWNQFGYDLDSDGGRLVSADDLLHSEWLEVVQLYGMDPRDVAIDME